MFIRCESLKTLDISKWDTSKVTDMSYMFNGCKLLEYLNLSGWNISNVISMSEMFHGCESLKKLNISGWDISNVRYMAWTFFGCDKSIIPDWYKNEIGSRKSNILSENSYSFNSAEYKSLINLKTADKEIIK